MSATRGFLYQEQAADPVPDYFADFSSGQCAVDYQPALRFGGGQFQITFPDFAVKDDFFGLEAVFRRRRLPAQTLVGWYVETFAGALVLFMLFIARYPPIASKMATGIMAT